MTNKALFGTSCMYHTAGIQIYVLVAVKYISYSMRVRLQVRERAVLDTVLIWLPIGNVL